MEEFWLYFELLQFSHIIKLFITNCLLKVLLQHLSRVEVRILTRPTQNLHVIAFETFSGEPALVLLIVVLLLNLTALELHITDSCLDSFLLDCLVESRIHDSINYAKLP